MTSSTSCQRWHRGRATYRAAGEVIETSRYEVGPIDQDCVAREFVNRHHYAGSYPAARFRFGMWRSAELQGIAVFSVPMNYASFGCFSADKQSSVELGRFVLLDQVPSNGETWMLGRCFELLRRTGIEGVTSFSDPVPRTTAGGDQIFRGHVGTIYQAHNGVYLGRSRRRVLRLLPDGTVLSERAIAKLRGRQKGWRYVAEMLVKFGADRPGEDLVEWSSHWTERLTRPLSHAGNHKYAWGLTKTVRRSLSESLAYPKNHNH